MKKIFKGLAVATILSAFMVSLVIAGSAIGTTSAGASAPAAVRGNVTHIYKTNHYWPMRGARTVDVCKIDTCIDA